MQKVILRLNKIEVKRKDYSAVAEFEPYSTLLFEAEIDDCEINENGNFVLGQEGLSEIIKNCEVALYFTTEKEDF